MSFIDDERALLRWQSLLARGDGAVSTEDDHQCTAAKGSARADEEQDDPENHDEHALGHDIVLSGDDQ
jgi:hypothetical protein